MDPAVRQPLSRTPSSNMHQGSPAGYPNMNPYPGMQYQTSQPQLPPIQSHQSHQPPNHGYMPQQYRPAEPARYPSSSGAPYGTERYPPLHQSSQGVSGSTLLPQPPSQYQPQHPYTPPSSVSQSYPQRIAPAPPRDNPLGGANYGQDGRWNDQGLGDASKDQRTHVVGSQGRRGILPSAPGRAAAVANGSNGTTKNTIPPKDADGKFPCPNCNKTYLHAKHLKRHLLRRSYYHPLVSKLMIANTVNRHW